MTATDTPILVIYFNRPATLERTLRALAEFRPAQLYFASDGPRAARSADAGLIEQCHDVVKNVVTWDCQIHTLKAESNLGCSISVTKAIDWFFTQVEQGIILEDDCIISNAFFGFAAELLDKYKNTERVMSISAASFQAQTWGDGDYYFSRYPLCWGWATWRRAWRFYDAEVTGVDDLIAQGLDRFVSTGQERRFWIKMLRRIEQGRHTVWDAKWLYSIWRADGISISPNCNLVSNIGHGKDATHTVDRSSAMDRGIDNLSFPLRAPSGQMRVCAGADLYQWRTRFRPTTGGRLSVLRQRISAWWSNRMRFAGFGKS